MMRDLFLDADSGIPNANPMGPLAGVKPHEIAKIVPMSRENSVRVTFTYSTRMADRAATYAQLAAWGTEQAKRFERVYPTEIHSDGSAYGVAFRDPTEPTVVWRGCPTRSRAAELFRDGLPRHEVFPDV